MSLGFWQLQRADQKEALVACQGKRLSQVAVELFPDLDQLKTVAYQRVFIEGRFDCEHQILLDNKMHNSQPGFHVITGFQSKKATRSILVNRGWIPMKANRSPDSEYLSCPTETDRIEGIVSSFPVLGFHFAEIRDLETVNWPLTLLELESELVSSVLNYPVVDYLLLMDSSITGGFVRDWNFTPNISSQKHIAYAVQWFGLAITLCIISVWKQRKK